MYIIRQTVSTLQLIDVKRYKLAVLFLIYIFPKRVRLFLLFSLYLMSYILGIESITFQMVKHL